MPRHNILALLAGGDLRSIGRSNQVAAIVSGRHRLFSKLLEGLWSNDRLVRVRAADAAEKVTRENPKLLCPHKRELLGLMAEADEPGLRWHLAAMIPRLELDADEQTLAVSLLTRYLDDRSSIVKTFALQGLADLARKNPDLRTDVYVIVRKAVRTGTPAMKARSRKLLKVLERNQG